MSDAAIAPVSTKYSFCSSLAADVWHAQSADKAYEWWYFDALSDDGREAVVIVFSDNYVFSPRYATVPAYVASADIAGSANRFPAITFLYSVDGKTVFRTISEFPERQFHAKRDAAECSIGDSSFRVDSASYGSGYLVDIDVPLGPARRLKCTFEWLSIEADLLHDDTSDHPNMSWNMVAPRSDVSGRIELVDRKGKTRQVFHFRGTGYHDHIAGEQPLNETLRCRQWGRAHFIDTTAVFCLQNEINSTEPTAKLMIVREGKVHQRSAAYEELYFRRDKLGLRYPARMGFLTEDNIRLKIKSLKVIESSFYSLRLLSEMTLMLRDGRPRKTVGITEFLAPKNIKYRLFRWFSDLQIGRNGKGPIF